MQGKIGDPTSPSRHTPPTTDIQGLHVNPSLIITPPLSPGNIAEGECYSWPPDFLSWDLLTAEPILSPDFQAEVNTPVSLPASDLLNDNVQVVHDDETAKRFIRFLKRVSASTIDGAKRLSTSFTLTPSNDNTHRHSFSWHAQGPSTADSEHMTMPSIVTTLCELLHSYRPDGEDVPMDIVKEFFNITKNANEVDTRGLSALHLAVALGCIPLVTFLLKAGADPKARAHWRNQWQSVSAYGRHASRSVLSWSSRTPAEIVIMGSAYARIEFCRALVKYDPKCIGTPNRNASALGFRKRKSHHVSESRAEAPPNQRQRTIRSRLLRFRPGSTTQRSHHPGPGSSSSMPLPTPWTDQLDTTGVPYQQTVQASPYVHPPEFSPVPTTHVLPSQRHPHKDDVQRNG